jgi:hypothetical protein
MVTAYGAIPGQYRMWPSAANSGSKETTTMENYELWPVSGASPCTSPGSATPPNRRRGARLKRAARIAELEARRAELEAQRVELETLFFQSELVMNAHEELTVVLEAAKRRGLRRGQTVQETAELVAEYAQLNRALRAWFDRRRHDNKSSEAETLELVAEYRRVTILFADAIRFPIKR